MNAQPSAHMVSPQWRTSLPALILVLTAVCVLYRDTILAMVAIWYRSETFTHGFVVLPIVLWLVWRRRQELAALTPRTNRWMLIPLAGLALVWLLGELVAINSVTQLAVVAMLVACVPAVLGFSVAGAIAFPLAFMFFSVPIGEFMLPQLMDWTADFTILLLRASGVPVLREGLNFVIPTGSWSVVEACSGVRYLIASLTVGTLYAYLNYQSTQRRVLFILVSILVPIVANWLRAYMIVMLGHLSGNTIAVGVDHLIYGWVFFGFVIVLMFLIGARWSEPEPELRIQPSAASPSATPEGMSAALSNGSMALAIILVVVLPWFAIKGLALDGDAATPQFKLAVPLPGPWKVVDNSDMVFRPRFENPSAEAEHVLVKDGQHVGMYIGYYRNQDYGRKLVSSSNGLIHSGNRQWALATNTKGSFNIDGEKVEFRGAEVRRFTAAAGNSADRLLVWQVYWINGRLTSSDYWAKIYGAVYQLLGRGDDSAVIVVYTAKDRSDGAQERLGSFLSTNFGAIDAALRAARDGRAK